MLATPAPMAAYFVDLYGRWYARIRVRRVAVMASSTTPDTRSQLSSAPRQLFQAQICFGDDGLQLHVRGGSTLWNQRIGSAQTSVLEFFGGKYTIVRIT